MKFENNLNIVEKTELKKVELEVKDQQNLMSQFFVNIKGELEVMVHKSKKGILF